MWIGYRRFRSAVLCLSLAAGLTWSAPEAQAVQGTFKVTMLSLHYDDDAAHAWSDAALARSAVEIEGYFRELSYGKLHLPVEVVGVAMPGTRASYWSDCRATRSEDRLPCREILRTAMGIAETGGYDFTYTNGVAMLAPYCAPRDFTGMPQTVAVRGRMRTVQHAYLYECPLTRPPGSSGVAWNAWAHEIGHMLEFQDGIPVISGRWGGDPGGYASGYDLMDSCYPCHEGAYGLGGDAVVSPGTARRIFPGWLDDRRVVTVEPPARAGTVVERTVDLRPLSRWLDDRSADVQVIKIPRGPRTSYLIEARKRVGTDMLDVRPGIYDEGVKISYVDETADPPVRPVDSCDTVYEFGCVRSDSHPRAGECRPGGFRYATSAPPASEFCARYALWHEGTTFRVDDIEVAVRETLGDGYRVTVRRGVQPRRPDVFLRGLEHCLVGGNGPWCADPRGLLVRRWSSPDVWLDTIVNGFESEVGPAGLRYGRTRDGTVNGTGDDVVPGHETRLYATVRNAGDAPATDVRVRFGVAASGKLNFTGGTGWVEVGTATAVTFPELGSLEPGASSTVYVTWRPDGTTPSLRVTVDPVKGEDHTGDQVAEESSAVLESIRDVSTGVYAPVRTEVLLENSFPGADGTSRTFQLRAEGDGALAGPHMIEARADGDVAVPVDVMPSGTVSIEAATSASFAPAFGSGEKDGHAAIVGGGATIGAIAVEPRTVLIAAASTPTAVLTTGIVPGAAGATVAVDYIDPAGKTVTRLARTDAVGSFSDTLPSPGQGTWSVRAIVMGDLTYATAVSPEVPVQR